eukprot:TRINITY_DN1541_c3_g1_i2.p4 TRINITY_DN1541_c3_g1~~TRINITY_DN1541_c3_g1_i2.p4  ORF type:complete len:155 (-),score=14.42 TRINITY_DN1541_c3_g1_i2:672-1136(-)
MDIVAKCSGTPEHAARSAPGRHVAGTVPRHLKAPDFLVPPSHPQPANLPRAPPRCGIPARDVPPGGGRRFCIRKRNSVVCFPSFDEFWHWRHISPSRINRRKVKIAGISVKRAPPRMRSADKRLFFAGFAQFSTLFFFFPTKKKAEKPKKKTQK